MEEFPFAEVLAARKCANRAMLIRNFYNSSFDDIEKSVFDVSSG